MRGVQPGGQFLTGLPASEGRSSSTSNGFKRTLKRPTGRGTGSTAKTSRRGRCVLAGLASSPCCAAVSSSPQRSLTVCAPNTWPRQQEACKEVEQEDGTVQIVTPYMIAMEDAPDEDDLPLTTLEKRMEMVKSGVTYVLRCPATPARCSTIVTGAHLTTRTCPARCYGTQVRGQELQGRPRHVGQHMQLALHFHVAHTGCMHEHTLVITVAGGWSCRCTRTGGVRGESLTLTAASLCICPLILSAAIGSLPLPLQCIYVLSAGRRQAQLCMQLQGQRQALGHSQ